MRTASLFVVGLAALSVAVSGQERQTFRTSTRLVEVSVVVTTGSGRPVAGLTQADFTVTENGKVQPISFFEASGAGGSGVRADESLFRVAEAPNTFSNVSRSRNGASTVLLLDRTNAAFDSQWYARQHIDRYLATMAPGERVALYVLAGSVQVLHDFSTDVKALRQSLEDYQARVTGDYVASNEPPPDTGGIGSWLANPGDSMSQYFMRKRAVDTFEMLEFLADHLAGISGRKNLVWVSEVFTIPTGLDRLEVLEKMHRANKALAHAQVSVYPVDSRGLMGAYQMVGRQVTFNTLSSVRGNIETMEVVAEETGGRAYANTNGLDRSIARAVEDSRESYVLGYYPAPATDGRFRRIDVKVKRPGVHVRHRSGYFAATPPSPAGIADNSAIQQALESPLQTTAVGLAATAARQDGELAITVMMDPATLSLEKKDSRWYSTVEVVIAQVDRRGRGAVDVTIPVAISLTDDERTRAMTEGIRVERTIVHKPGAAEFRIVARDVATGKVGSLVIPATRIR